MEAPPLSFSFYRIHISSAKKYAFSTSKQAVFFCLPSINIYRRWRALASHETLSREHACVLRCGRWKASGCRYSPLGCTWKLAQISRRVREARAPRRTNPSPLV
ncbi:unnamed protein product [Ectocarpus sp. 12 AP-2014]